MKRKIEKHINKNKKYLSKLYKYIEQEKEVEKKLELIEFSARFCSNNCLGMLFDQFLENNLKLLSKKYIRKVADETKNEKKQILHVVTMSYETGGHTRLINNIVRFDKQYRHSLIVNYPSLCKVPEWLEKTIKESGGTVFYNTAFNLIEKAQYLYEISSEFEFTFCYLHTWEVVTPLAFYSKHKTKVFFYNQADHLFNIGMGCAEYIFDMSKAGCYITNKFRIPNKSIILPIPINVSLEEKRVNKKQLAGYGIIPDTRKIILSIASEEKYNKNGALSFDKFIIDLLRTGKYLCILVGPNPKKQRWKKLQKKCNGNLLLTGRLNKKECEEIYSLADIYLDSFPMDSATCTLDAAIREIPCVSLKLPEAYVDALMPIKYDSLNKVKSRIEEIEKNKTTAIENAIMIKKQIMITHCCPFWLQNLHKILNNPQKYISNGEKAFEIEDYYEYIAKEYLGTHLTIKRADVTGLCLKNKTRILKVFKLSLLISLAGRVLKQSI